MKLRSSTCRKIARNTLEGRKPEAVAIGFGASLLGVFTNLFSGFCKLALLSGIMIFFGENVPYHRELTLLAIFVIAFLWVFVGSFVRLGYLDYNLSLLDQRQCEDGMLFGANTLWYNSLELRIRMLLLTLLGTMFFIIPGIMIYYNYAMAPFLLEEQRKITVSEAMRLSREKMKGHKKEFFDLRVSFLLWRLLGFVTLGIAFLWVNPYYSLSEAVFFNEISGRAAALYGRD